MIKIRERELGGWCGMCGGNEIYTALTEEIKSRSRKEAKAKDKEANVSKARE